MNFLAHLYLAGADEGRRLGAMLGDFTRGGMENTHWPDAVSRGILLHRHIDQHFDGLPELVPLRGAIDKPFRRYAGIIIDLGFDRELAKHWAEYSDESLQEFDRGIRDLLVRNRELVPQQLDQFMAYADRRGLFASYRNEEEILHSLRGIGHRLSRPNPLHRVSEIWDGLKPLLEQNFERAFPLMRQSVADWRGRPRLAASAG